MTAFDARIVLEASFLGGKPAEIVRALCRAGWFPDGTPERLEVDYDNFDGKLSLEDALGRIEADLYARFESPDRVLRISLGKQVQSQGVTIDVALPAMMEILAGIPFETCVFGSRYGLAWTFPNDGEAYRPPSLPGHVLTGWAAAFRGRGHDVLVSRRWLETGPFKLWRGPNDTSLVQFHSLEVDAATALEQAKPGHAQIGNDVDTTGYLQTDFVYTLELKGLYDVAAKTMKVVIHGRQIPDRELLEWAAMRRDGRDGVGPIERVAFIFMGEAEAQRELPRLWRYGHEVWAIREGREVRLDAGYTPPVTTPNWAR